MNKLGRIVLTILALAAGGALIAAAVWLVVTVISLYVGFSIFGF